MADFTSSIAAHQDLSEEEQKKAGKAIAGNMGDAHKNFLQTIIQMVKRRHDLSRPGYQLLIPLYNLYLLWLLFFKRGTPGPNQYGDDPLA